MPSGVYQRTPEQLAQLAKFVGQRKGAKQSPETVEKMRAIASAWWANPENKEKMVGRKLTADHREKLRQAKLRNPVRYWQGKTRPTPSDETRAKISAANKGRKMPEGCGIGKHNKGVPRSPEVVAKMRAAMNRPEVRAKLRGPNPNKARSAEHYEKVAAMNRGKPARFPMKRYYYAGEAFRSSWEMRVAKALDAMGVRWLYEPTRFDLVTQTYAPDFYLPDGDCYWEVKGYYGPKSKKTISLFRQHHPGVVLLIVNKCAMEALERAAAIAA